MTEPATVCIRSPPGMKGFHPETYLQLFIIRSLKLRGLISAFCLACLVLFMLIVFLYLPFLHWHHKYKWPMPSTGALVPTPQTYTAHIIHIYSYILFSWSDLYTIKSPVVNSCHRAHGFCFVHLSERFVKNESFWVCPKLDTAGLFCIQEIWASCKQCCVSHAEKFAFCGGWFHATSICLRKILRLEGLALSVSSWIYCLT